MGIEVGEQSQTIFSVKQRLSTFFLFFNTSTSRSSADMDSRLADSNMSLPDSDKADISVNTSAHCIAEAPTGDSEALSGNAGAGDQMSGNGEADNDNMSIGADLPRTVKYKPIRTLIKKVKNARKAFHSGGYDEKGKHWTKLLPDQAEVLLPGFLYPFGEVDREMESVAKWLEEMDQGWMLSITGNRPGNNDNGVANAAS
ncbi:hypothetical protein Neosp_011588 [[Neocosmospora] mangrovei]